MRGKPIVGGVMLLLVAAACATGRRAAEPGADVVRESQLDSALTTLCDQGASTQTVSIPVQMVVRPDGKVASARANGEIPRFHGDRSELRHREQNLRAQARSRAASCRFSAPTRGGRPVHARVQRTITVTY